MMISTRGRYALRVLVDLAEHDNGEYTAMKTVAARQGVSLKYLEKILPILVGAGLLEGVHGKGGGYRLARDPAQCRIGEILRLTEGNLVTVSCLEEGSSPCEHREACRTFPLWNELDRRINEYLDSVTLADLMKTA